MKNGITINELDDTLISKINKGSGDTDGDISKLELSADKIKLDNKKYKAKNVDAALTEVGTQYEDLQNKINNIDADTVNGKHASDFQEKIIKDENSNIRYKMIVKNGRPYLQVVSV